MLITKASNRTQIKIIVNLAKTIWRETYVPIIGEAQVKYMLKTFQSEKSITEQLKEGLEYYLVSKASKNIGYFAISIQDNDLFLSKIYISTIEQGKGFGKNTLLFIEQIARQHNAQTISLSVNKNNIGAIKAYKKMGFINLGSVIQKIGNGFIMDDYKMIKKLY